MFTVVFLKEEEEDPAQIQVVIPNLEDQTNQHKIIMFHQDNRSTKTKASNNILIVS